MLYFFLTPSVLVSNWWQGLALEDDTESRKTDTYDLQEFDEKVIMEYHSAGRSKERATYRG